MRKEFLDKTIHTTQNKEKEIRPTHARKPTIHHHHKHKQLSIFPGQADIWHRQAIPREAPSCLMTRGFDSWYLSLKKNVLTNVRGGG